MSAEEWVQFQLQAGRNANLARKAGRQPRRSRLRKSCVIANFTRNSSSPPASFLPPAAALRRYNIAFPLLSQDFKKPEAPSTKPRLYGSIPIMSGCSPWPAGRSRSIPRPAPNHQTPTPPAWEGEYGLVAAAASHSIDTSLNGEFPKMQRRGGGFVDEWCRLANLETLPAAATRRSVCCGGFAFGWDFFQ